MSLPWYRLTYEGYCTAMHTAGLKVRKLESAHARPPFDYGLECSELLAGINDITALLAGDDEIALGLLAGFGKRELRTPEDLSAVGFDDIDAIKYVHPPLTTVRVPKEEVGAKLGATLFESLQKPSMKPVKRVLPTALIVRESCAPPARQAGAHGSRIC
jgi:DNA-binding LacI/PurR family transcriptional regulator